MPSIQSLQPPSHEGTLGPSAAEPGDCCPILALADEDPWMGWQLVSDVVSGRSESTLKARLSYLERYFAWCSDHRLPWVPLTVSATWKRHR